MNTSMSWTQLKQFAALKNLPIQLDESASKYYIFLVEGAITYSTIIYRLTEDITGIDETQNAADLDDFEANYKADTNKPISPKDEDGRQFLRAEGKPLSHTTCFTSRADSDTGIGDGKKLKWDFSNSNDEVTAPEEYKRKRIEFNFLDSVYIKDGTIYYDNVMLGSYVDFYVVCPNGETYLDNNGNPQVASEDTPVSHYIIERPIKGISPTGDKVNTETVSKMIPNNYKFWLEITVPVSDVSSTGAVSIELYRKRTVIL